MVRVCTYNSTALLEKGSPLFVAATILSLSPTWQAFSLEMVLLQAVSYPLILLVLGHAVMMMNKKTIQSW